MRNVMKCILRIPLVKPELLKQLLRDGNLLSSSRSCLHQIDLRSLSPNHQQQRLAYFSQYSAWQSFNMDMTPLLPVIIIWSTKQDWIILPDLKFIIDNQTLLFSNSAVISFNHEYYHNFLLFLNDVSSISSGLLENTDFGNLCILQAEANILLGRASFQEGNYSQARIFCQQALMQLPNEEIELRITAELYLGICKSYQGDFLSSIIHLQQVFYNLGYYCSDSQTIDVEGTLAYAYCLSGNFVLAKHYVRRALKHCDLLCDEVRKIDNLIRKGFILSHQGESSEAEANLLLALMLIGTSQQAQYNKALIIIIIGSIYLESGAYSQALSFCEDGLAIAMNLKKRNLINIALANIATTYVLTGDASSALFFIEKMDIQANDKKFVNYELACCELAYGITLLYLKRYDEAYTRLVTIETSLRTGLLKRALIQAKLRLSACLMAQGKQIDATRFLEEIYSLLTNYSSYKQLVLAELKWFPAIVQLVKKLPHLTKLRELLGIEDSISLGWQEPQTSIELKVQKTDLSKIIIMGFGEPVVLLNNKPIEQWRMRRAKELFFFLLEADAAQSRETIITALWPEFNDQTVQTFHSTLHHLRKLFGSSCIVFHSGCYSLNMEAHSVRDENIWYDVREFQLHYNQAKQALARTDDDSAKTSLQKMLKLYQGDYGRSFYNDWCSLLRETLRTTYIDGLRQMAQIAWRSETFDESIGYWRQILNADNCLEEAHYGIMHCYLSQTKRSEAMRQYQRCKEILQQELGIRPGSAIQALYWQLTNSTRIN